MRSKSAWVLALVVYLALLLAACIDDTASPEPLTGDGGIDSALADTGTTVDTGTASDTGGFNFDALADAGTDAPPAPPDGGAPDGGDGGDSAPPLDGAPPDGGLDGSVADASGDAGDSGTIADSGIDTGTDSGPVDAGTDAAPTKGDNCSNKGCGPCYKTGHLVKQDGGLACDAPEFVGPLPLEICGNDKDDSCSCKADKNCSFCAVTCPPDTHCNAGACVADILATPPTGACGENGRCPDGKHCLGPLGVCVNGP